MPDTHSLAVLGSIAANGDIVMIPTSGLPAIGLSITGTWVGTLEVEENFGGSSGWTTVASIANPAGTPLGPPFTANQNATINASGRAAIRVRASAFASGTATVILNGTLGVGVVAAGGGGGGASTIADGADITQGAKADTAASADTGTFSVVAILKRLLARLTTLLPQNAGRLNVDGAGGTFPVTNANLDAATSTLVSTTDFDSKMGSLTETAPATDTASAGHNGRLQRIAQRITSLIALLPAALVNGALVTTGDVAAGVTDAGNPVKIGALAVAHGANPTAVSAGQRANCPSNLQGIPFVSTGHPNLQTYSNTYTGAQTDTALVTVATGTKIIVMGFSVKAANSNTVDVSARLGLGTATVPADGNTQLIDVHPGIAPGSGFAGGPGMLAVGADDQDLRFTCSVPTGGSVQVSVKYYTVTA